MGERYHEHADDRGWRLKILHGNRIDESNIINVDFAPSVAEADAILAATGYAEREALVA